LPTNKYERVCESKYVPTVVLVQKEDEGNIQIVPNTPTDWYWFHPVIDSSRSDVAVVADEMEKTKMSTDSHVDGEDDNFDEVVVAMVDRKSVDTHHLLLAVDDD
jgi:hypothetical protein